MTSEVGIANRALQILGSDPIISLSENNKRARALRVAFDPVRDAELHRRNWRFSIKRTSLAALAETPDSGFAYQYQVPTDYLRLLTGGDLIPLANLSDYRSTPSGLYAVEGDRILTDVGAPLSIRYVARITDTSKFSASFAESLAARLAWECCDAITQSDSKQQLAERRYMIAMREARRANAFEVPSESIADGTWMLARAQ